MSKLHVDVVVIGAGVIGSAIARELSKYDISCVLVEKDSDVCEGTSKANNGIVHAGYAAPHGTLKAKLNVLGSSMYPRLVEELSVPFERRGSLVVAFAEEEIQGLYHLLSNGTQNGVKDLVILNAEQSLEIEPNLNPKVLGALYAPSTAITCPYELTIALCENALANGVKIFLENEVKAIRPLNSGYPNGWMWNVITSKTAISAKIVVNAAGVYADTVASLVGDGSFSIKPRKGEYFVLDKTQGGIVSHVIFPLGSPISKGITLTPTVDGNILLGPSADYVDEKDEVSTSNQGLEKVMLGARKLVPSVPLDQTIAQYAGLRATLKTEDFLIEESRVAPGVIHVAGIQSPGLASAPAIALRVSEMILGLLEKRGLKPQQRKDWNPFRKRLQRFSQLSMEERAHLVAQDPDWGVVVCRCEIVTKKEVLEAIRGPLGARTMDAIKRRTRAGMGRCQGGFCTPKIASILAKELGVAETEITKSGPGSNLLAGRTKSPDVAQKANLRKGGDAL